MTNTNKTIKSKNQPKQTNVTWIDLSGETPVEKHFINGRWIAVSSSGGAAGSSNPTEADATKVWQVTPIEKSSHIENMLIVPQQTVTDAGGENSATVEFENIEYLIDGTTFTAIVNGIEYSGEVFHDTDYDDNYYSCGFEIDGEPFNFTYIPEDNHMVFTAPIGDLNPYTVSLSVVTEVKDYDYNWAPGVKIPIPTAEDEGKILVVTKVEGDNTSTIVPEQQVPADTETPLTNVDLTKFVVGNTVKVTITYEGQPITETGVIEDDEGLIVYFYTNAGRFGVWKTDNSLYTTTIEIYGPDATIKLEYGEPNYEYQLQENSGGSSNVLWPAIYEYEGEEIMATFVPEDVEPGTWCMVCGHSGNNGIDTCLPVIVLSYQNYTICNNPDFSLSITSANNGEYLNIIFGGGATQ